MAPIKAKKVTLTLTKAPVQSAAKRARRTTVRANEDVVLDPQLRDQTQITGPTTTNEAPAISSVAWPSNIQGDPGRATELEKEVAAMRAALEQERLQNVELRKQIGDMADGPHNTDNGQNAGAKQIPRPQGTAGTHFSIQDAMGLSGSTKKYETYKAIQRNLRDLTLNARINWEVPWAQVPARDKAKLFEVVSAREQHPFLSKFERDWATEEIVKQFVKNKRKNHYANGWLDVPAKYAYLKQNSLKRNPVASRSKRALAASANGMTEPGTSTCLDLLFSVYKSAEHSADGRTSHLSLTRSSLDSTLNGLKLVGRQRGLSA